MKMLLVNPQERLSARDALEHPWFATHCSKPVFVLDGDVLENLHSFRGQSPLGALIVLYLVANLS